MRVSICLSAVGLVLAITGCRPGREDQGHSHDGEHGHDHEEKTAQVTVWTSRHEVFAEHQAPVLNKPARFVTHITDLDTLEPRSEGLVKFVLRQGETVFEHPQAAPERPGIYIPAITFPKTGDWVARLLIPTGGSNSTVELGIVKVYADDHTAAHAEFPEVPEGVSFLKEQQWKILSKAEPVTKRKLVQRVQLPALVRAKPGFSANVVAPLSGHVAAPAGRAIPLPGTRVDAGEVLALLQPRFSEAAAGYVEIEAQFGGAEAALKQAETNFQRTKKLATQQAKSEREVQEAEVTLATARARYDAAASLRATYAGKSPGNSFGMELRSPIAGVITTASVGSGEPVTADQNVFTVLNSATVWVEGRVSEFAARQLGEAGDALLEFPGGVSSLVSIKSEGGRLVFAGLEVDPANRTVPLLYELPNINARLRIGEAVWLHVETARSEEAIAIPDSAIVEEGGQPVAFVQVSGETFEKRELKLGIHDGEFRQVLEGLKAGERVVTKGAYAIRLSSISGVIPAHGHAH